MSDKLFSEIMKHLNSNKKPKIITILGKKLIVMPRVFDPEFIDSQILAEQLNKLDEKFNKVLDLGTGTGIQTIFISPKAKEIIATDITPYALENANLNVELHNLQSKITLVKSDLFSAFKAKEKFDLIIFNPPFFNYKPKNIIETAITDENHKTLKRFFKEVKDHLNKDGRIIMLVSDIININLNINSFNNLIKNSGFNFKVLNERKFNSTNYFVYLLTSLP